ncbi:MAG TPA: phosphoenolpyruvate carboxykinase (ATP) [Thermotogota bacterium]|nr:phosphoenolpyruvate carboxykinase (ATP) [Thermotogota bacterium]HRW93522.1 phosphoenolpyruvate carboxykinase (ATP) [Thermotogota bacterium]
MATIGSFKLSEAHRGNPAFSSFRTTIETAFFRNNVEKVFDVAKAYELAAASPGTIETGLEILEPEHIGLPEKSRVLLFNDGTVTGRCAAARRIAGTPGIDPEEYSGILREAVYQTRLRKMYHASAVIGLARPFMVKAHLLVPQTHENILYNWMLNFQPFTREIQQMYNLSHSVGSEPDILVFSDPDWRHPDFPLGLSFFDPLHNCAAILGMRYFGEFKKGTLTLGWGIANRNGYAACHGGQKKYQQNGKEPFVVGFFGLSGSGKSTLTHAKHDGKYDVVVLHDDAFIISETQGSSIALEPTYFDKTADYPPDSPDNRFLLSVQNNGAILDESGRVVPLTEDVRNGNGRAIKSRLWSPNRVDELKEPVQAIIWLMKDSTLPPVLKVKDPILAATMGASLATKRTSAERLAPGVDPDALVFEPYANPFRTYPLQKDYVRFKALFEKRGVDCYVFNTGFFQDTKIPKQLTLSALEAIVEDRASFQTWQPFASFQIMELQGFRPPMEDFSYLKKLSERMKERLLFFEKLSERNGGFDQLPDECLHEIQKLMTSLNEFRTL